MLLTALVCNVAGRWRHVVTLILMLSVGALAASMPGCLIPAPIEQEEPPEDLPPFVDLKNDVDPPHLDQPVIIDLSLNPLIAFAVLNLQDPNEEQPLHARFVVDYGESGAISETRATPIEPAERASGHSFNFDPCNSPLLPANPDGTTAVAYIGVSDSPFVATDFGASLELELTTEKSRDGGPSPFIVSWTIEFVADCPD